MVLSSTKIPLAWVLASIDKGQDEVTVATTDPDCVKLDTDVVYELDFANRGVDM